MARVPSGMTREGEHPGLAAGLSHVRGKAPTSPGRRSGIGHCYIFTASFDLRAMGCGRATVIANKRRPISCSIGLRFVFSKARGYLSMGKRILRFASGLLFIYIEQVCCPYVWKIFSYGLEHGDVHDNANAEEGDGGQNDQRLDDFQPAYKQDAQDEYGKRNAPDVL